MRAHIIRLEPLYYLMCPEEQPPAQRTTLYADAFYMGNTLWYAFSHSNISRSSASCRH